MLLLFCSFPGANVWRACHWFLVTYGCCTDESPGYLGLTRRINTPSQKVMMFGIIEDYRTHTAMMSWRVMFCKIISQVVSVRGPEDVEVALLSSVADPVEPHVDCSGSALFAGSIGDRVCGGIICLDWCGGLRMAHFFECRPEYCAFFGI